MEYWVWINSPNAENCGRILIPRSKLPNWQPFGWVECGENVRLCPSWHFYTDGETPFERPRSLFDASKA